ncbi:MAG: dTDP-4-dehydrorhamnose 3,5-epimerase [Bacteroidales bacterium]|jgi:dTDP-4-dehydrorhamnose 3,5-epimerase|nr:dTDP-4-dehydrorhamnose 3,5-epimerase [Bacteroidales bacterium]MCI1784994.1 dTDP-4-dehydrorhamnose 3,5-epimerase [Bacteroidales bacterium]
MEIIRTGIAEVVILLPKIFNDGRGYFFESYSQKEFNEKVRTVDFVQDNESRSTYGVLRGLHFQQGEHSQSKLVRVVEGSVLDVAVDIRKGSPTFGKYVSVLLTGENHKQFFVPRGFAHGFSVLSETAVFQYKCDRFYAPLSEGAIAWNDPDIGIDWMVPEDKVILSGKDECHPFLKECDCLFDYKDDLYEKI